MYRVLVADDIDPSGISKLPSKKFNTVYKPGISNAEIFSDYSDFDILVIRSIRKIDKSFLDKVNFKVIATGSKGTDHIDMKYASLKKIKIINSDEGNTLSAAEHTLALILNIYKGIQFSDKLVREGNFTSTNFRRNELYGKTIGIIGFGKVGSIVGKLSKAFGMKIIANDIDINLKSKYKNIEFTDLSSVLLKSDIVTIHIPLNKKNQNFISEKKLNLLNENSILINTSRGGIIDEECLLELLKKKKIRFAGLDVYKDEPYINRGFAKLDNVLLTNHIAGKTLESRKRISDFIFSKLKNIKE